MAAMQSVNDALGRYYESLSANYDNELRTYCEDNGYDDDETFTNEMQEAANDCMVMELFDDFNFPFPPKKVPEDEDGKKQFIYDLIKKCMQNPGIGFSKAMPNFVKEPNLFKVTKDDLDAERETLRECKALWSTEFNADGGLLTMLAVGRKNNIDYLQHLVDDYNRWRVRERDVKGSKLILNEWSNNHPHFKQMKHISVEVILGKETETMNYEALVHGAVSSFGKRICGPLKLKPMQRIDDSLEIIVMYINNAVNFVWNKAKLSQKEERTICPFQMDFCFAVGKSVKDEKTENIRDNDNDDDDGDDDDDDDDDDSKDNKAEKDVGDIKKKLKKAGSKYTMAKRGNISSDDDEKETRIFGHLYDSFLNKNKLKDKGKKAYLYQKRLIAMIDRRKSKDNPKKEDDIWMYEPSKDYKEITNSTVSEWYFNSSIGCLLPNKNEKEKIGANDHCNGGLVTLSFHVKELRKIKCYLYWSGTMIRFMPDDIKDVLPQLFNPDRSHVDNSHGSLDEMIANMKKKLVDEEFCAFQATYNY